MSREIILFLFYFILYPLYIKHIFTRSCLIYTLSMFFPSNKKIAAYVTRWLDCLVNPTFAIRAEKQSFSGINRLETLGFTGVDFQNGL